MRRDSFFQVHFCEWLGIVLDKVSSSLRNLTPSHSQTAWAPTVTPQCPLLPLDRSAIWGGGGGGIGHRCTTSSRFSRWITLTPWRGAYPSSDVCHRWHAPATVEWVGVEWGDVWYGSAIPTCPFSFCRANSLSTNKLSALTRIWGSKLIEIKGKLHTSRASWKWPLL